VKILQRGARDFDSRSLVRERAASKLFRCYGRDRGFESVSLQQRVRSEPGRQRSVTLMHGHGDVVVTPSPSIETVPRVMAIAVHPFVTGQPHRIGALDAALEYICSHPGVWRATGWEIVQHFLAQQPKRAATAL
jgi:hypothetical protein